MSNPYQEAYDHVNIVRDFVTNNLQTQLGYANTTRSSVSSVLSDLSDFNPSLSFTGAAPMTPTINVSVNGDFDLPAVNATDFGTVSPVTAQLGVLGTIREPANIDIAPFMPSITGLTLPEAPQLTAPLVAPTRPTTPDVLLPDAPRLDKPSFPSLEAISIPAFSFPTLPTWSAVAPEFAGTAVSSVLQWSDPQYLPEVMPEVITKLREMWAGASGIPPAIENALWERAANREDLDTSRQVSAVYTDFSGRGFTEPPGMLVARVDAIREEAAIRKQGLNRDIAAKMAEIQIENVRFAVEQGVAAENVLYGIWNNMAQRQFEAAKIQLDSQLALYNAQIALFNARQQAYSTEAQVFKTRLDAELARIEVFKAELEGELARGTLNEQRVRIYGEQIKALLTDVEIYKAQMQGASVQSDVNKNIIDGFRAEIQAYAERINADKVRFDAYDSQVKGELGKAQILDSEAKAYASYITGQAAKADIGVKVMQADIAKNEQILREYAARLEADKAKIQADVAKIQASASAYTADTQRFTAQAGAEEARARVEITAKEAEIRASLSLFDVEVRKYIADMEQMIRKANVQLEALKAAGQVGATLSAGAMAGINIGASLSGSGSVSASGSASIGESRTRSDSVGYSYSGDVSGDVTPRTSAW